MASVGTAVASVGTAVFIGLMLVVGSMAVAVEALFPRKLTSKLPRLLLAAITCVAGIYLLVSPLEGTFTLTFIQVI